MTRWLCVLSLLAGLTGPVSAQEKPKIKALMLTQSIGFKHDSVNRRQEELSPAEIAMTQLGQQTGLFEVHCTQNAEADFTKENLAKYQLVMFYTTGNLPIGQEHLDYFFKEWLPTKGHAFVGFHSASDTFHDYQPYWDMVGGTFTAHPWNAGDTVTISVHDTDHPAMKPFGEEFQFKDEIYQYKNWQPDKVRLLMSLNMAKNKIKRPYLVPISWVKEYGEGRVFYTNLGHNIATWTNPQFLAHVRGGIEWSLGLAEGSGQPNPELSARLERKARADGRAASNGRRRRSSSRDCSAGLHRMPSCCSTARACRSGRAATSGRLKRATPSPGGAASPRRNRSATASCTSSGPRRRRSKVPARDAATAACS
jgi:uncharacterized protein